MLETGFKSSRKFSKKIHLWDLLERVCEQLSSENTSTSDLISAHPYRYHRPLNNRGEDEEMDCRDLFLKAVSRINSNNTNIGKDEKVLP